MSNSRKVLTAKQVFDMLMEMKAEEVVSVGVRCEQREVSSLRRQFLPLAKTDKAYKFYNNDNGAKGAWYLNEA